MRPRSQHERRPVHWRYLQMVYRQLRPAVKLADYQIAMANNVSRQREFKPEKLS